MRKMILSVMFLGLATFSFAQKQFNDANAVARDVKGFHALKVSQGITVYLTQSSEEAVAVSATEPEVRDRIVTEVVNGVLIVRFKNDDWKLWKNYGSRKLRVYVSAIHVDGIEVSSGALVKVEGAIKSDKLNMDASSGAEIMADVEAGTLSVDLSSGSTITLSGKVSQKLRVEGSSGSVFKGYDLVTDQCDAETSSGAGIQITVNKELSVNASSGGYIRFKGEGLIRDVKTSSGGSVSRKS